ncbi:MAG: PAS domain S-box protein [Bacteroidota bacterium]
MAEFKNISIKNKLILIQVATAFIAAMICSAFFLYNDIKTFKSSEVRNKKSIAEIVGVNLIPPLLFYDQDAANKICLHLDDNPSILNAVVFDKSGKKFAGYTKKGEANFPFPMPTGKPLEKQRFWESQFIVSYRIFQEKEFLGTIMLRAELDDLNIIVYNYLKTAILILIFSIFSAFIISNFLQRIITNRLLSLVHSTEEVTETGNYSLRISAQGKDEIGVLSEGFNSMLEQIEKTEKALREANLNLEERVKERTASLEKTQEFLKLSEEKYRKLVEEAGDVVYTSDYKGYFTYINPMSIKLTGYTEHELIGKHFSEIIDPEWKEKVAKFYKEQFDNKIQETLFAFPIITKSGEKKWIEQTVIQQIAGDRITGHQAIVRDITSRKKIEEEIKQKSEELEHSNKNLKDSEQQIQAIFDSAPDAVIVINHESTIIKWNHKAEKLFDWNESEVLGKPLYNFIIPERYRERHKNGMKHYLATGEGPVLNRDIEIEAINKNGNEFSVSLTISPVGIKDKILFIGFIRDITQRKQIEGEIKQKSEELLRSNQELEQFAYVASHDLQEPLRTIYNFVGLLDKKYSGKTDDDAKGYFKFIVNATSKMQNLIKDLLEFSRVGKNISFTDVDCNKILKEVIADLDISIKESNAKITSATLPVLQGNETELKRLFQNLISNAIKFRKKNVSPEITITVEQKEKEYLFAIRDNGIGIEEKHINKLFIIFQRLHSVEEYPGTGIGLATCKKIVTLHKGKIWVESKLGEGSTFYFTLPKEKLN